MRTISIVDVLSWGPIIASDGAIVVTWNESLTLNSWSVDTDGRFRPLDTCTLGSDAPTLQTAKERAIRWLAETNNA